MKTLHNYIGLAGVNENESLRVRQTGKLLHLFNIPVIIWLALQWHLELLNSLTPREAYIANLCVWLYFVLRYTLLAAICQKPRRYLISNYLYFIIIILGLPFVFDAYTISDILCSYRLLLVLLLLVPWVDACFQSLSDNHLGTTLITALFITLLAGILIAGIDPNIHTFLDGIWWAWVTVSTVGYGDVVPVSLVGRIFGTMLILMGLGLFSVITANFSAFFVQKEVKKVKRESLYIRKILEDLQKVKAEEEDILQVLKDIRHRLSKLEGKIQPD